VLKITLSVLVATALAACAGPRATQEIVPRTTPATMLPPTGPPPPVIEEVEKFGAGEFTGSDGVKLVYRLLSPAPLDTKKRYPLVLVLHGANALGNDNRRQLGGFNSSWARADIMRRFPAFVLVPQFPDRAATYAYSAADGLPSSGPGESVDTALELLDDILRTRQVDLRRVYVVGVSMGASTTWNALLLRPNVFAAAIPVAGIPPARDTAARFNGTSLLIVHGSRDIVNPIAADRAMYAALRAVPDAKVRFREYEGLDHQVPPDMLASNWWREWLFAQRR
jgi:predicted peptidase